MSTPSFAKLLRQAIDARLVDVHTAMPGKVTAYDVDTQRASVQPLLKRGRRGEDGERVAGLLPIVVDVPVSFPLAAAGGLTFPIAAGDTGLLVFTEGGLDVWLAGSGREVDPGDDRRFTLTDAVFIPGTRATPAPSTAALEDAVVLSGDDVLLGDSTATSEVALKAALDTLKTAITNAVIVAGDGGASFKSTLLTALTGWPASGCATKVKAK